MELGDDVALGFVIGTDVLTSIESWQGASELVKMIHLIVVQRPGSTYQKPTTWEERGGMKELLESPSGGVLRLANRTIDVSSTTIRNMLAHNKQPRYMMPGVVWNYICRNRLYGWEGNET